MSFSVKPSFFSIFLLVFCVTLVLLGSMQAILGTLRWYNSSEESLENLQKYPIYSASEEKKPSHIRVTIAPKPLKTDEYVFVPILKSDSDKILPAPPSTDNNPIPAEIAPPETIMQPVVPFKTPVRISQIPLEAKVPEKYPETIEIILTGIYFRDVLWNFPLTIDVDRVSPRWQMHNESVILSGRIKTLPEVAKVLVHELGHMVDIYLLRKSWKIADPSKLFYSISWTEPTVLRSGMTSASFASGYAATNQYEDFAEAFTLYVFHNKAFAERAKKSPVLQQKYDFMTRSVFGEYFKNTSYELNPLPSTLWDVTKIAIKTNALTEVFTSINQILKLL